ncbi:MAG: hypothetical protein R3D66_04035 [Alphaproteobacteria bacterium]
MSKTSYIESGKKSKEIEAKINERVRSLWADMIKEDPELEAKYKIHAMNVCYHKRSAGAWRIVPKIAECLLWKGYAEKTQKAILEKVREELPNQIIHDNIWSRELSRKELGRVEKAIKGNMVKPIDIKGCRTLSQIKKRLVAANRDESEVYTFKTTIKVDMRW